MKKSAVSNLFLRNSTPFGEKGCCFAKKKVGNGTLFQKKGTILALLGVLFHAKKKVKNCFNLFLCENSTLSMGYQNSTPRGAKLRTAKYHPYRSCFGTLFFWVKEFPHWLCFNFSVTSIPLYNKQDDNIWQMSQEKGQFWVKKRCPFFIHEFSFIPLMVWWMTSKKNHLKVHKWAPSTRLHSEKFKMNRNGNSILSENICDLLLGGNVFSILLHYKCSGFFIRMVFPFLSGTKLWKNNIPFWSKMLN